MSAHDEAVANVNIDSGSDGTRRVYEQHELDAALRSSRVAVAGAQRADSLAIFSLEFAEAQRSGADVISSVDCALDAIRKAPLVDGGEKWLEEHYIKREEVVRKINNILGIPPTPSTLERWEQLELAMKAQSSREQELVAALKFTCHWLAYYHHEIGADKIRKTPNDWDREFESAKALSAYERGKP